MRDVLDELAGWWRAGAPVGLATVVGTWRSAPRQPGAAMIVGPDGTAVGSVSGGCVEGAVYERASEVRDGAPPGTVRYGVSDDDAFAVGLTCGGIIDLFVERIDGTTFPHLDRVTGSVAAGQPVAVVTCVDGPPGRIGRHLVLWPADRAGSLGSPRLDDAVADDARGMLAAGRTGMLRYGPDGERRGDDLSVFVTTRSGTQVPTAANAARGMAALLRQTSRFWTSSACFSMNSRRGSTASPIRIEKTSSASTVSSTRTCSIVRFSGSIVVSQSCCGFISPSPL